MPRALKNLDITLGLAVIPVQLFTATRSQGVAFHLLHAKCGSRIQMRLECPIHGIVPREETVKEYETAKDEYVRFEPEELKALEQASSSMVVIDSFVPETAIDPVYFEDTYYLGAGRTGTVGIAYSSRLSRKRAGSPWARSPGAAETTPIAIGRRQDGQPPPSGIYFAKEVRVQRIGDRKLGRRAAIRRETLGEALPLFYCPFTKIRSEALFRPSLARIIEHPEAYEFDIVFVDLPGEIGAVSAGPLTTVGSLLRLAHMFRFGWIEHTADAVSAARPNEIPDISREMGRRLSSITAECFNQGIRTETAVLQAFSSGSELQSQAQEAMAVWKQRVAPNLTQAVADKSTDGMLAALREASKVNWQFHRACASRYAELVEQYWRENADPLSHV